MGNTNTIPIVSQVKSLVQVTCGDVEGAKETQEIFSKRCLGVSQVRSLVEASLGDNEAARRTQCEFLENTLELIEGVPVAGHIKGVVHYILGQTEDGDRCMKSSSRTTAVMGAAAVVALTGGAVAPAALAAVGGGLLSDGVTTGIDSAVHGEFRPTGYIATGHSIHEEVKEGKNVSGTVFDMVITPVFDAATGKTTFHTVKGAASKISTNRAIAKAIKQIPKEERPMAKANLKNCVKEAKGTPEIGNTEPVYSRCKGDGVTEGTGYNGSVASRINTAEYENGNPQGFRSKTQAKNYRGFDNLEASRLEQSNQQAQCRAPGRNGELRNFRECAEHAAAEAVLRAEENIATTSTVQRLSGGKIIGKVRCENCTQFNLGKVPTDALNGVHLNPSMSAAAAIACAACAALRRRDHRIPPP